MKYAPTQIYVGQILFTTGTSASTVAQTGTITAFNPNSTLNVVGANFAVSDYVMKVKPNSTFAYNLETSKITFQ